MKEVIWELGHMEGHTDNVHTVDGDRLVTRQESHCKHKTSDGSRVRVTESLSTRCLASLSRSSGS